MTPSPSSSAESDIVLRPIRPEDDPAVEAVIRTVMPEFGASGPGFAIHDPEVSAMCAAYQGPRSAYFVAELGGRVVGGAGIGPLAGAGEDVCELRKMYLLKEARGRGAGRSLIETCLRAARELGYRICYLETLKTMTAANALYRKNGFQPIPRSLGNTGHFGCDAWYVREV